MPSNFISSRKWFTLKKWKEIIDDKKQVNASIPNIIHFLDSTHLINLINKAENQSLKPIITVHDCYSTLPNKMAELKFKVKKEFILLYTKEEFLKHFIRELFNLLKIINIKLERIKQRNLFYVIMII